MTPEKMEREKAIEVLRRLADGKSEELYIFDDEGGDICGQILEEQEAILAGIEALKETERNPTITSWYDFDRGYEKGKADARPHGEWIARGDNTFITCNNCGFMKGANSMYFRTRFDPLPHYCEYCGADMRKEGDENG